jgi:CII-binding regulator of phage lambda lysogenization HflD
MLDADYAAILQTTLLIMLGVIGWFLRGIYANIQKMADSIQSLNERLIRHEEKNTDVMKRLDRAELRLEHLNDELHQLELNQKR